MTIKPILLSIIIPYRNTATYLKELLDSIGDNPVIEIIVIDDQSDQNLVEFQKIKKEYSKINVKFLENTSNKRSAGIGRNLGLKYSTGKWVMFADADDFFIKGYYDILEPYLYSDNDVVFFEPTSLDRTSGKLSDRHMHDVEVLNNYLADPNQRNILRLRFTMYTPWSKLIKRSFIEKHGLYFHEVFVKNDSYFSINVGYYMNDFAISTDPIYCATWHSEGQLTTRKPTSLFIEDSTLSRVKIYKFLQDNLSKQELEIIHHKYIPSSHYFALWESGATKDQLKRCEQIFAEYGIKTMYLANKIAFLKKKLMRFFENKFSK